MSDQPKALRPSFNVHHDSEIDRSIYGHHEGRYMGPHEEQKSSLDNADFLRRVWERIELAKAREARSERREYGRERTLER